MPLIHNYDASEGVVSQTLGAFRYGDCLSLPSGHA